MTYCSLLVKYKRQNIARGELGIRISSTKGFVHGRDVGCGPLLRLHVAIEPSSVTGPF